MLDTPKIEKIDAQAVAVVRLTIPREEIVKQMRPAIEEVFGALATQKISPIGPVFSHHFRMDPAIFDFEVGVPVGSPIIASGRVIPSQLPAVTVARVNYFGPYEGLGEAWVEFCNWMRAEKLHVSPDLWERYVKGPESGEDPSTWRTELIRPLTQ